MAGQARQSERPSSILKGGKMRTRKETSNKDVVEGHKDLKLRKITKNLACHSAASCELLQTFLKYNFLNLCLKCQLIFFR